MVKRNFKVIGSYLREKRNEFGKTQQQVSKALGLTSPQYISNVERGLAPLSLKNLRATAEFLGVDKNELLEVLMGVEKAYLQANLCRKRKTQ